ncbi:MAG: phosphatase PAP2 family protein [Bacteroidales bacterium]|nr:phosphatase PAP2 family protein [Bacteroidales bacterium]
MRRLCLLLLLLAALPARAQFACDTLERRAFRPSQLIAPGVLVGAGLGVHYFGHEAIEIPLNDYVQQDLRRGGEAPFHDIGTYVQYVPSAMHLGLGLVGCRASHSFLDRAIESSVSHLLAFGLSRIPKYLFHSLRPDGGDYKSFPSGHTILAFTGAELVRMDYGPLWGAGAYAMGIYTAADRIYGNRHWLGDVLAGAGLGILAAHAGEWLLKPVKSLLSIPDCSWDGLGGRRVQLAVVPYADPLSSSYLTSISIQF